MAYLEEKVSQARSLLNRRVQIPVHYDMWMRGARYGVVTSMASDGSYVRVTLDKRVKPLKVWRLDFDYMTPLD